MLQCILPVVLSYCLRARIQIVQRRSWKLDAGYVRSSLSNPEIQLWRFFFLPDLCVCITESELSADSCVCIFLTHPKLFGYCWLILINLGLIKSRFYYVRVRKLNISMICEFLTPREPLFLTKILLRL